jgi:hypothetical protein
VLKKCGAVWLGTIEAADEAAAIEKAAVEFNTPATKLMARDGSSEPPALAALGFSAGGGSAGRKHPSRPRDGEVCSTCVDSVVRCPERAAAATRPS